MPYLTMTREHWLDAATMKARLIETDPIVLAADNGLEPFGGAARLVDDVLFWPDHPEQPALAIQTMTLEYLRDWLAGRGFPSTDDAVNIHLSLGLWPVHIAKLHAAGFMQDAYKDGGLTHVTIGKKHWEASDAAAVRGCASLSEHCPVSYALRDAGCKFPFVGPLRTNRYGHDDWLAIYQTPDKQVVRHPVHRDALRFAGIYDASDPWPEEQDSVQVRIRV